MSQNIVKKTLKIETSDSSLARIFWISKKEVFAKVNISRCRNRTELRSLAKPRRE
ncbi:hypothetical protein DPMN_190677 [Dreissena polymorpha]|uniref:Uncharacterized protein n=1 Tax=Dreissena polymorpha TaxID=45954 RepID=A0A9D3Y2P1_DREPO|nr:hypothetical protein DPMN_190677 [Dreissena polymorpha]